MEDSQKTNWKSRVTSLLAVQGWPRHPRCPGGKKSLLGGLANPMSSMVPSKWRTLGPDY